jgi:phage terminase large subunit
MTVVRAQFPEKAKAIFTPAPYKVIYGGRGKSASWSFARAALILGSHRPLFVVCGREVQKSIKDSVHKLLCDQIERLGLQDFYDPLDVEIRGKNGTVFSFIGLNNIQSIKSMEAIDVLWVTEATHVPKSKWIVIEPTVRCDPPAGPFKQGSEIWIDLNPELVSDDTYQRYIVDPPSGALVIEMNYRDNPFFPEILRRQMMDMRAKDYDEYLTVWEGKTRKAVSGSIYHKELAAAIEEGRIGPRIRHDKGRGVVLVFDLGDSDMTAAWAFQQSGSEHNAIDYMEESGRDISYFIKEFQDRGYIIKGIWLPHDARQKHQAARSLVNNTIEKQAKALVPTPGIVKVVPNTSHALQINAARALFPRININEVACSQGVLCLQHFQYGIDPHTRQRTKEPLHNWASHGAKAFGYYAVQLSEGRNKEKAAAVEGPKGPLLGEHSQSWMGI